MLKLAYAGSIPDARREQWLRHAGLRGGHAYPRGHPRTWRKNTSSQFQRYRWRHAPALRLCRQSASEEAGRENVRLNEDRGRVLEDALLTSGPHRPCRLPRGDSLQPGTDGQADDC